jgi:hypothetical protein
MVDDETRMHDDERESEGQQIQERRSRWDEMDEMDPQPPSGKRKGFVDTITDGPAVPGGPGFS